MDKLHQQEKYDINKGSHQIEKPQIETTAFFNGGSSSRERFGALANIQNAPEQLAHKSTMTLAEKKRIQWEAEKGRILEIKHLFKFYLNLVLPLVVVL